MGYNTRYTGEIRIDPAIPADELSGSGFVNGNGPQAIVSKDVALKVVEEPVSDSPGLYRRLAVAIIPAMQDAYTGYDAIEHVQEIVDRWGEGRTFTGRLDCEGEEAGDLWRLYVRGGRATRVEPRIVWPDDEPALVEERFNAGVEAAAKAIEAHAESIGWYESSGTWADAIEKARGASR